MKRILVSLLSLVLCFSIVGCAKKSTIIGTWKQNSDSQYSFEFEFKEDNSGTWSLIVGTTKQSKDFDYKIDENKIYVTYEPSEEDDKDEKTNYTYEYKLDGNTLTLKDETGEENKLTIFYLI